VFLPEAMEAQRQALAANKDPQVCASVAVLGPCIWDSSLVAAVRFQAVAVVAAGTAWCVM
jgi:hypothetical protein